MWQQTGLEMTYDNSYARLPPDPLCREPNSRVNHRVGRKERKTYFHVPTHYMQHITGKGLTAAALVLLLEAHRRVAIEFGPLPLTAHTGQQLGLNTREMRTARMQLQRHPCSQWTVFREGPRGAYKLSVDTVNWTDKSGSGDTSVIQP